MTNEAVNRILALPGWLERHNIYRMDIMFPHFGSQWAEGCIRDFEATPSPVSITYKVDMQIDGQFYDGELEVRMDGTHAVRMVHQPA